MRKQINEEMLVDVIVRQTAIVEKLIERDKVSPKPKEDGGPQKDPLTLEMEKILLKYKGKVDYSSINFASDLFATLTGVKPTVPEKELPIWKFPSMVAVIFDLDGQEQKGLTRGYEHGLRVHGFYRPGYDYDSFDRSDFRRLQTKAEIEDMVHQFKDWGKLILGECERLESELRIFGLDAMLDDVED